MVRSNESIASPNMKTLTPLRAAPFFCKSLLSLDAKMEELIICTSLVHEKKFVIKKCSRFSFICKGHVILYILQEIVGNKDNEKADMDKKLWVTLFANFLHVTMRWPLAFAGASRSGLTTAWLTVAISLLWSLFWFYRITMVIKYVSASLQCRCVTLYAQWQMVFNPDWIQMCFILTCLELGIKNSHLTTKPI